MEGSDYSTNDISPSNFIEEAIRISDCGYEYGTDWGKKVSYISKSILLMRNGDML
jgi:hypothetical protein